MPKYANSDGSSFWDFAFFLVDVCATLHWLTDGGAEADAPVGAYLFMEVFGW